MTEKATHDLIIPGGFRGRILRVDLSESRIWEEDLSKEFMEGYFGGAGITARLLQDLLSRDSG